MEPKNNTKGGIRCYQHLCNRCSGQRENRKQQARCLHGSQCCGLKINSRSSENDENAQQEHNPDRGFDGAAHVTLTVSSRYLNFKHNERVRKAVHLRGTRTDNALKDLANFVQGIESAPTR